VRRTAITDLPEHQLEVVDRLIAAGRAHQAQLITMLERHTKCGQNTAEAACALQEVEDTLAALHSHQSDLQAKLTKP